MREPDPGELQKTSPVGYEHEYYFANERIEFDTSRLRKFGGNLGVVLNAWYDLQLGEEESLLFLRVQGKLVG